MARVRGGGGECVCAWGGDSPQLPRAKEWSQGQSSWPEGCRGPHGCWLGPGTPKREKNSLPDPASQLPACACPRSVSPSTAPASSQDPRPEPPSGCQPLHGAVPGWVQVRSKQHFGRDFTPTGMTGEASCGKQAGAAAGGRSQGTEMQSGELGAGHLSPLHAMALLPRFARRLEGPTQPCDRGGTGLMLLGH